MLDNRNEVRAMLVKYHLSQTWLQSELEKRGLFVDKSTLSAVLLGRQVRDKKQIVDKSLEILDEYGSRYANN